MPYRCEPEEVTNEMFNKTYHVSSFNLSVDEKSQHAFAQALVVNSWCLQMVSKNFLHLPSAHFELSQSKCHDHGLDASGILKNDISGFLQLFFASWIFLASCCKHQQQPNGINWICRVRIENLSCHTLLHPDIPTICLNLTLRSHKDDMVWLLLVQEGCLWICHQRVSTSKLTSNDSALCVAQEAAIMIIPKASSRIASNNLLLHVHQCWTIKQFLIEEILPL